MDNLGRDYLRETLKEKGEADTVEDMLRLGFHWSKFVSVRHLHMHLLYPTGEVFEVLIYVRKSYFVSNKTSLFTDEFFIPRSDISIGTIFPHDKKCS